ADPELGAEREDAALAGPAVDPEAAAHERHEVLGNRQPQPRSAEVPGCRSVGLREGLEDNPLLLEGDADPGVDHLELQHGLSTRLIGRSLGTGPWTRLIERW